MSPEFVRLIVGRYPTATAWERLQLRRRLRRSHYESLLPYLPNSGNLLEIDCDVGQLRWFLEEARSPLQYYGSNTDRRKIALGKTSFGEKAGRLFSGKIRHWKWLPTFSAITLLEGLVQLPIPKQKELFDHACNRLEPRSDSVLLLKIPPPLRGLARWRTRTVFAVQNQDVYLQWGREQGFEGQSVTLPDPPISQLLVFKTTRK